MTDIYDYLRLLFCKLGEQHCPQCGERIGVQNIEDIVREIRRLYSKHLLTLLAPLVRKRKGIYRDLFKRLAKEGISQARIDGRWTSLEPTPELSRFREHDIEIPIEKLGPKQLRSSRLRSSVDKALKRGGGVLIVLSSTNCSLKPASIP